MLAYRHPPSPGSLANSTPAKFALVSRRLLVHWRTINSYTVQYQQRFIVVLASIDAHADGRWCAYDNDGGTNCGFYSQTQCMADVEGAAAQTPTISGPPISGGARATDEVSDCCARCAGGFRKDSLMLRKSLAVLAAVAVLVRSRRFPPMRRRREKSAPPTPPRRPRSTAGRWVDRGPAGSTASNTMTWGLRWAPTVTSRLLKNSHGHHRRATIESRRSDF